jgi:hypothetical protein
MGSVYQIAKPYKQQTRHLHQFFAKGFSRQVDIETVWGETPCVVQLTLLLVYRQPWVADKQEALFEKVQRRMGGIQVQEETKHREGKAPRLVSGVGVEVEDHHRLSYKSKFYPLN